jgi:predicted GNAT family N-acyltransferase
MSDLDLIIADELTLPLVQHLRYRVYCAEKQFAMPGAHHKARLLRDDADPLGQTFALFDGAELVSSAQVIPVDPTRAPDKFAVFGLSAALPSSGETCVVVSKLVTAPERRGSKTLGPIMRAVLDYVAQNGHRYIAILAEPTMREFYSSMGFDIRKEGIDAPPFGTVALMIFDMQDERHTSGRSLAGWMFKSVFAR